LREALHAVTSLSKGEAGKTAADTLAKFGALPLVRLDDDDDDDGGGGGGGGSEVGTVMMSEVIAGHGDDDDDWPLTHSPSLGPSHWSGLMGVGGGCEVGTVVIVGNHGDDGV
jgi:hypothetical protein